MTATAPAPAPAAPLLRLLLVLAALLGTLLAAAAPASAHAALTASDPKDGAVVATGPAQVSLSFSEQVALGDDSIRVMDPAGKRVDTGELRNLCEGSLVKHAVVLHSGLPNGTYTVAWQAVSADSHPISGAFTFSIGAPSKTSVVLPDQAAGGGPVGLAYGIARYVAYAGFILLVGGAAFVLLCWRRGAGIRAVQRVVLYGWAALTAATLTMLVLRTPYTGSGKFADAFDLTGLQAVLETKTGASLVSRLLLLGAAALFVAVLFGAYARRQAADAAAGTPHAGGVTATVDGDSPTRDETSDLTFGLAIGGTVVAGGIAATWALSEHASTGIQPGIAMPVDIFHLLAVAAWLGGLVTLLVALYRVPDLERAAVQRFSKVAFASVIVLVATGIYQSWRQLGTWSALTGTDYGKLLIVKVGLIVVLVGVAYVSRQWTARLGAAPAAVEIVTQRVSRETSPEAEAKAEAEAEAEAKASAEAEPAAALATEPEPAPEPEPVTVPEDPQDPQGPQDPKRAAQLARQRAAQATALEKKTRDADPDRAGLRRSVLAEAAVAVVLLAVATTLTSTEPGRAAEQETGRGSAGAPAVPNRPIKITLPFDTGGEDGKGTARLQLDPGRTGSNTLHLWLDRPNGKPLDAPEVKVSFTLPAKDVGPLPLVPDHAGSGHWTSSGVQLPLAGTWRIDVTVRTSDIDQTTVNKNVKIG
ncbi:copper resistance CopC/CopD family protein [Streptomyces sp. NBC_00239]|uniref:copper resistance CopC/CopD family protein n=1 Tax=Streptomyces sp. NBC_00239 TaxID=2903640 RepID=UPI002E2A775F|nr:copper resistance protein CopC [Streptomyces sp. NBC_00239]